MNTDRLVKFINERHRIYVRRLQGLPKPWTQDKILQRYSFCNVYRELDTVTKWITEHWRTPHRFDKDLWFAMTVARLVNWPDTLQQLEPAVFGKAGVGWNPERFVKLMHKRKDAGQKVFSGAYIVSTNGRAMDKAEYLAAEVLTPLWERRETLRPITFLDWAQYHERLCQFQGMGSFMSGQVVADIKYAEPLLHHHPDWWTFAASGPGSRRGLNRVMEYDKDSPWKESAWRQNLAALQLTVDKEIVKLGMDRIHAQDLQNCLCEFDKMERTRLGEGRPRALYKGV